jgi:hypothetical protein
MKSLLFAGCVVLASLCSVEPVRADHCAGGICGLPGSRVVGVIRDRHPVRSAVGRVRGARPVRSFVGRVFGGC